MEKRMLENEAAEQEANDVAYRFMNSSDVVSDMEQAYGTSFANVTMHSDAAADAKVKAAGRDAIASGHDIFFGKGILESKSPESKGLMAHELTHIMQQSKDAEALGLHESVAYGEEEGGLIEWFKGWNARRKLKNARKQAKDNRQPVTTSKASDTTKLHALEIGDEWIEKSNQQYQSSVQAGKSRTAAISDAFQAFGHRSDLNETAINAKAYRNEVFTDNIAAFQRYAASLDQSGMNYNYLTEGLQEKRNYSPVLLEQSLFNSQTVGVTNDLFDILQERVMTENGLDYFRTMLAQIEGADVFKDTGIDALDYVLQAYLTAAGIQSAGAMRESESISQVAKEQRNARSDFMKAGASNLMIGPALMQKLAGNGGDIDALQLDPDMRSVLERYIEFKNSIAQGIQDTRLEKMHKLNGRDMGVKFDTMRGDVLGRMVDAASVEEAQNPVLQQLVTNNMTRTLNSRMRAQKSGGKTSMFTALRGSSGELASYNLMVDKLLPQNIEDKIQEYANGDVAKAFDYMSDFMQSDYADNEHGVARLTEQSKMIFDGLEEFSDEDEQSEFVVNNLMLREIMPRMSEQIATITGPERKEKLDFANAILKSVNSESVAEKHGAKESRNFFARLFGKKRK